MAQCNALAHPVFAFLIIMCPFIRAINLREPSQTGSVSPIQQLEYNIRHESSAVDAVIQGANKMTNDLTSSLLNTHHSDIVSRSKSHQKEDQRLSGILDKVDKLGLGTSSTSSQPGHWKTLSMWVVSSDIIPSGPAYHSQVGQDASVIKCFEGKHNGFFVDLAANDPVTLSNTLTLERDYGWKGICIEANPIYWSRLAHRKCQLFGVVVGQNNVDQLDVALQNRGVYGGIVGSQFDNKQKTSETKRRTVSLEKVLLHGSAPPIIDYLSLDVEGAEEFIMKRFPFGKYRFNLMTIERPSNLLQEILKNHSYIYMRDHGGFGDQMWRHESFKMCEIFDNI